MSTLERNKQIAAELRALADIVNQTQDEVTVKVNVNAHPLRFKDTVSEFLPNAKVSKSSRGLGREMFGGRMDICVMRGDA